MGCTVAYQGAFADPNEVCKEEEEPMVDPRGSWTPIVAVDFSSSTSDKEKDKDLHGSELQLAQLKALCVLAMLPGCGETDLHCTREVHGFGFGASGEDLTDFGFGAFDGFLELTESYREASSSSTIGSGSERSFAKVIRHCFPIADSDHENLDANRHAIVILTNGPLSPSAFHETLEAVQEADRLNFGVICIGVGREFFGVFLEETLPEMCRNFRFLALEMQTGNLNRTPSGDRTHCALAIQKAAVHALRRPVAPKKPTTEVISFKRKEKRCKKFCVTCGRLPNSESYNSCPTCRVVVAATEEGCGTAVTVEAFASSDKNDMGDSEKETETGVSGEEEEDSERAEEDAEYDSV